jgi:hypothetical protein
LLFPRIIIVETYYLDLVDVIGCVCLSIFWLVTSFPRLLFGTLYTERYL